MTYPERKNSKEGDNLSWRTSDVQSGINHSFEKFKKNLEKQLGKMGLSLAYANLSGVDIGANKGGIIIARFNDKEGHPITLVQNQEIYVGRARGTLATIRKVYRPSTIWCTIVNGLTPFTMLFKRVSKGFLSSADMFMPFTASWSSDKEMLSSPLLQTSVVEALNSDKVICKNIGKLALKCSLDLTHKAFLNIGCSDMAGKCAILPMGNETAVFLRNYGIYGDTGSVFVFGPKPMPESVLEAISRIRKKILSYPCSERVLGRNPAPWTNAVYALSKAVTPNF